jgi:hypothetical protein
MIRYQDLSPLVTGLGDTGVHSRDCSVYAISIGGAFGVILNLFSSVK